MQNKTNPETRKLQIIQIRNCYGKTREARRERYRGKGRRICQALQKKKEGKAVKKVEQREKNELK